MDAGNYHDQQLIVHNWTHQRSITSSQDLLEIGRGLVDAAKRAEGWYQPHDNFDYSIFERRGREFVFSPAAPVCSQGSVQDGSTREPVLKEWNTSAESTDELDVFTLECLDDFQSTDISHIIRRSHNVASGGHERQQDDGVIIVGAADSSSLLGSRKREVEETHSAEPARKRPRLENCPLHQIIPYPHYHASLIPTSASLVDMGTAAFYSKASPIPISPYTTDTVRDYLDDPYARAAWVIPLRGGPPWEDCTPASILAVSSDALDILPQPPCRTSADACEEITWTPVSLQAFWAFLIELHAARTLGPLALSFHATPDTDSSSSWKFLPAHQPESISDLPCTFDAYANSVVRSRRDCPALRCIDHIKIYHDVTYTVHVRNVVHAWAYKVSGAPSGDGLAEPEIQTQKIRLFKGARLLLVDARSRPILTC
ncbi:hypothetical protein B0H21DRAFT_61472 [Amylocystis lapponica]|nr:hypothetical protein B0H21DRAFT_61472 [Amylocystis lapponica]